MKAPHHSKSLPRAIPCWQLIVLACLTALASLTPAQTPNDLTQVSLEDLMKIQVTSVAKKEQAVSKTGAAVFVITQEEIRRSGMSSIPELLRMVPGVEVAQIDANQWAISIRGFNFQYATKVLVLIDGRTVYTPLFSGVYWDQQDVPLEDIDRIEVIRGPGGTVWGANAVNGVINIITRKAQETQGGLLTAGTGSEQSADGLIQYGGTAGKSGAYRVFGRYFKIENSSLANGGQASDGWHASHAGFRSDWDLSRQDTLTVQGDLIGTSEGQTITTLLSNQLPDLHTFNDKVTLASGNLLGRWNHTFSNGSEASLQMYYDHDNRLDTGFVELLNTGDLDFQYHFQLGKRQDIVVGGGYRLTDQQFTDGYSTAFTHHQRRDQLLNSFLQDEITITPSLAFTIGSKLEHNSYTGYEYEPSAQVVWSPGKHQTIWGSVSRAIRQPAWFDVDSRFDLTASPLPNGGFALLQVIGGQLPSYAEKLLDFEAGYRAELTKRVSLDFTVFRSHYTDLQTMHPATPYFVLTPAPPHLILPYYWANLGSAHDYGAEFFAHWNVTKRWLISPGYSFLERNIKLGPANQDFMVGIGDSPKHQAQVRSILSLPHHLEWDVSAYYVSQLSPAPVASYTRLDTRLGWHTERSLEFSVAAQNLLVPRHFEFFDAYQINPTYVQRSVFGRVTWRF